MLCSLHLLRPLPPCHGTVSPKPTHLSSIFRPIAPPLPPPGRDSLRRSECFASLISRLHAPPPSQLPHFPPCLHSTLFSSSSCSSPLLLPTSLHLYIRPRASFHLDLKNQCLSLLLSLSLSEDSAALFSSKQPAALCSPAPPVVVEAERETQSPQRASCQHRRWNAFQEQSSGWLPARMFYRDGRTEKNNSPRAQ